jgi:hypothetical protein
VLLGATGADEGAAAVVEAEPEPVGKRADDVSTLQVEAGGKRADDVSTASDAEGGVVTYGRRKVALSKPDPGDEDDDEDDEDDDDDDDEDDEDDDEDDESDEEDDADDNLLRAEALYDFAARNENEISFTKGGAWPVLLRRSWLPPPDSCESSLVVCVSYRVVLRVVCGACRGLDRAREGHQRVVEGGGAKEAEEAGARQRRHQRRTCGGDDRGGALELPPRPLQGPLLQLQALLQGSPILLHFISTFIYFYVVFLVFLLFILFK